MEYGEYLALYSDGPEENEFDRFRWEARRIMDRATTGIDGVRKLAVAPPTEEYAAQAVRRCEAALVRSLWRAEQSEGYVERPDGTVTGRIVAEITAGSERISYAAPQAAGGSDTAKSAEDIVREYLSGVADRNGVMLLYMGRYPVRVDRS